MVIVKAFDGRTWYTRKIDGGIDEAIFVCAGKSGVEAQFLFTFTGEYRGPCAALAKFYVVDFDGNELYLTNSEINSTVAEIPYLRPQ